MKNECRVHHPIVRLFCAFSVFSEKQWWSGWLLADLEASRKSRNVEASEIDDCWIGKSIIEQRIRNREYGMNAGFMILLFVCSVRSVISMAQANEF